MTIPDLLLGLGTLYAFALVLSFAYVTVLLLFRLIAAPAVMLRNICVPEREIDVKRFIISPLLGEAGQMVVPAAEPAPEPIAVADPPRKKRKKMRDEPKRPSPVKEFRGALFPVLGSFHADECASGSELAAMLRAEGLDVTTTYDAGLIGVTDETQLRHATRERRVLITYDSDFLKLAADRTHAGVVWCEGGDTPENRLEILRRCLILSGKGGHRGVR